MIKTIAVLLLMTSCLIAGQEDYPTRRQAALDLSKSGEDAEALAAFEQMASDAVSPLQISDALEQAALCAHRLKDADRAVKLAQRIPLAPVSKIVQMRMLLDDRKWEQLVADFKDESMSDWSREIAGEACYYRGMAYAFLRDAAAAEADLKIAVANMPYNYLRGQAMLGLADLYVNVIKDDAKALEVYTATIDYEGKREKWGWKYFTALVGAAAILRNQGLYDQALNLLSPVDVGDSQGHWPAAILTARGEIHAASGDAAKAKALFEQALQRSTQKYQKNAIQERLDALQ